jgi:DNA-binding LacI/PurR family transcriptional regulator
MNDNRQKYYTIDDIAKELGVSKTTVSRAISGKGRIGAETRERVKRFIGEHNYRPNVLAKGLAQNKTFNIGLAMPEEFGVGDLPFFQKCVNGICQTAAQNDYDVILFRTTGTDLSQLKRIINNHKVDGVIQTRTIVDDNSVKLLKERDIPFVVIGSSLDTEVTHADNDHVSACRTLTNLLLSRGLRHFALIGGAMEYFVNRNRLLGYQTALEEYQGNAPGRTYLNVTKEPQIAKAVDDALSDGADCIVCMDDFICSRVAARLAERSVRVPDDISVATFYSSILLEHNNPLITGLEFDATKLGGIACQMLIDKLAGENVDDFMSPDYRLLIGNSTK